MLESGGFGYQLQQTNFTPGSTPQIKLNKSLADLFSASGVNIEDLELTRDQQIVVTATGGGGGVGGGPVIGQRCMEVWVVNMKNLAELILINRKLQALRQSYQKCLDGCGTLSCPKCADCEYPCVAWCLKGSQNFLCTELVGFACYQCETYKNNPNHPSVLAWQEFCYSPFATPRTCGPIDINNQNTETCKKDCESQFQTQLERLNKERQDALARVKSAGQLVTECTSTSA
jgi:hypothetical protein